MISLIEPRERQWGRARQNGRDSRRKNFWQWLCDRLTGTHIHMHKSLISSRASGPGPWQPFIDKPHCYLLEILLSYKFHESCCIHFFEVSIKCALVWLACLNLSLKFTEFILTFCDETAAFPKKKMSKCFNSYTHVDFKCFGHVQKYELNCLTLAHQPCT